ncbi:MAG: hypothetical protein MUO31_05420 [Thermodesulfovibrionales bacterium]|nr:hypothetical protein [Thermodesulfovibrionales bacterium]
MRIFERASIISTLSEDVGIRKFLATRPKLTKDELVEMCACLNSIKSKRQIIMVAKWMCKNGLQVAVNRLPALGKVLNPENLSIELQPDEIEILIRDTNGQSAPISNLYITIAKNMGMSLIGSNLLTLLNAQVSSTNNEADTISASGFLEDILHAANDITDKNSLNDITAAKLGEIATPPRKRKYSTDSEISEISYSPLPRQAKKRICFDTQKSSTNDDIEPKAKAKAPSRSVSPLVEPYKSVSRSPSPAVLNKSVSRPSSPVMLVDEAARRCSPVAPQVVYQRSPSPYVSKMRSPSPRVSVSPPYRRSSPNRWDSDSIDSFGGDLFANNTYSTGRSSVNKLIPPVEAASPPPMNIDAFTKTLKSNAKIENEITRLLNTKILPINT